MVTFQQVLINVEQVQKSDWDSSQASDISERIARIHFQNLKGCNRKDRTCRAVTLWSEP